MSKASIFEELCSRNALRRESGLPLLDMRAEYERGLRREAFAEYQRQRVEHQAEFKRIQAEVLAELQAEHGPRFGGSPSGHYAVNMRSEKRFVEYLSGLGIQRPALPSEPVGYGEEKP